MNKAHTAWKMFVFGVFLVHIFPHWDWIRTIKNPKTETFHVVSLKSIIMQITHQAEFLPSAASKACTSFHYSTQFLKTNVSRKSRLYFPFNVLNKPNLKHYHCVKCVQIGVFFWSVFSLILTEYFVSLRIESECGKIRTRKTPYLDTFHAVYITWKFDKYLLCFSWCPENVGNITLNPHCTKKKVFH